MQTIDNIRRERLLQLIAEHGTQAALARVISKSPAQISQWVNRSPNSATGKPRVMDSATAREIESACGKAVGWMDQPTQQTGATVVVAHEPRPAHSEHVAARLTRDLVGFMAGLDPLLIPSAKDVIRQLMDQELDERQAVEALSRLEAMSASTKAIASGRCCVASQVAA